MATDDVIALNDTSAGGAIGRALISALPFVQAGQKGLANGVGSLDANGRQPIKEAADGAAEETALVVTSASYTLGRRCIIARDGCNEIQLTSASGPYKNVYISSEKTSGSVTIRAVPGQTINGQPTYSLVAGKSVVLIVIGDAGQTAWRAESGSGSGHRRSTSRAADHYRQPRREHISSQRLAITGMSASDIPSGQRSVRL